MQRWLELLALLTGLIGLRECGGGSHLLQIDWYSYSVFQMWKLTDHKVLVGLTGGKNITIQGRVRAFAVGTCALLGTLYRGVRLVALLVPVWNVAV